jgi:TolB protein
MVGMSEVCSAADVVITSEQKGTEVIALGYVEFHCVKGNPGAVPYAPGTVLTEDLNFSGRFKVRFSPTFDTTAVTLLKQDGALAYLRGNYTLENGQYTLHCELVDLDSGSVILQKDYSGPQAQLRMAAHQFADELVYQLFGEKGIAQTRITYVNKQPGGKEIEIMDYDGADAHQVTRNKSINLTPIFLGAKDKVLFTSYAAGAPQFFSADMTASKTMEVYVSAGMNSAPSYNALDQEIVYASTMEGNTQLFRRPLSGGKAARLTFSEGIDTSPSWSPNGYEIVFVSDRAGKPMLFIIDRDGSNLRRLTYDFNYYGSPSWSPKGDRIAFVALDSGGTDFNVYTITPEGKDVEQLTRGAGSNESPSWSPDGRHITFMSTRTGSPEIFVMAADGSDPRRLTFSGGNSMPSWSDY